MDTGLLSKLTLYVVDRVNDSGGFVTTIRLHKFLYLIDLEHQRRLGRRLTSLEWIFHLYGPYAFEIPGIGRRLGFDLQQEEFETEAGYRGRLLTTNDPQEMPSGLARTAETVVDGILYVWADRDTAELLDYVYCTEPMRSARRGETLDFGTVPRGTRYYELYFRKDREVLGQLRASLESYSFREGEARVRPNTVRDQVLFEGLAALDSSEESLGDLSGFLPAVDLAELGSTFACED